MTWIESLPHEACGSSDALQVWSDDEGGYNGYCFACNTYVAHPYGAEGEPAKEIASGAGKHDRDQQRMREICELYSVDLPARGLEKWALERFSVKVEVSQTDGVTPVAAYFPVWKAGIQTGFKGRMLDEKKMFGIGDCKKPQLFGWDQAVEAGGRKLFITEGEFDAVALYQAIVKRQRGTKWEEYLPSVVSVPNGAAGAARDIGRMCELIKRHFKEVVLCFDMDEAGDKAVQEVMALLPRATRATLPANDANAALLEGKEKALVQSVLFNSVAPKNTLFVSAVDLVDEAMQRVEWGMSWPWPKLTDLTRGIRMGETIYLGAGVKMGKSTCVYQLANHLITEHDMGIMMACIEEPAGKVLKQVASKHKRMVFHDPKVPYDDADLADGIEGVKRKLHVLKAYQEVDWQSLRADIVACHQETGARAVFIDPITNLTNGIGSGEANTMLQDIAQSLAALARDLDIIAFMFCHLNNPESGPAHNRGGAVMSHQFAGSRAMMRSCHLMLGLEGNKDPNLPEEERDLRKLVVLEDRAFGESGYVDMYYDRRTGILEDLGGDN